MLGSTCRPVTRANPSRLAIPLVAIPLVLLLLAVGCGPSDPLEKVRVLQDEKGDFKGSLEPLRKLIEARPDDPEVHYRYGRALIATGDTGLAVWSLEKAIESPDWLEKAGLPLASTRISPGRLRRSGRDLQSHPRAEARPRRALLLRANAHMLSRRDYEQALADADRVLELDPDNDDALVAARGGAARARSHRRGGRALDELEALYRDDGLDLHGSPALCMARADVRQGEGRKGTRRAALRGVHRAVSERRRSC